MTHIFSDQDFQDRVFIYLSVAIDTCLSCYHSDVDSNLVTRIFCHDLLYIDLERYLVIN